MKIKNLLAVQLVFIFTFGLCNIKAVNKMPAKVTEVRGSISRKHTVVHTIITQQPKTSEDDVVTPVVTRSVKGVLVPNKETSVAVDVQLKVPEKEIELKSDIPDMIAKIAGAVPDPRVGLVAGAASVIVDAGLEIAGNELNKKYGNDPLTISLVEILPNQYYRIDTSTGKVQTTEYFDEDLPKYTELKEKYISVAKSWNEALRPYLKEYTQWRSIDPLLQDEKKNEDLTKMYKESVEPALKDRLEVERELQKYSLYRYAIMAVNTAPGKTREAVGCKGPWQIFVYFFIGAKQTNVFEIDYCVPNTNNIQDFIIDLIPNFIDARGNFKAGGMRLVSTLNKSIYFPVQTATERINLQSLQSRKLSWNDEMLVDENADVPAVYSFPFDIYNIKNLYGKMVQEKKDERSQARLDKLDEAVSEFQSKYPSYKAEQEEKAAQKEAAKQEKAAQKESDMGMDSGMEESSMGVDSDTSDMSMSEEPAESDMKMGASEAAKEDIGGAEEVEGAEKEEPKTVEEETDKPEKEELKTDEEVAKPQEEKKEGEEKQEEASKEEAATQTRKQEKEDLKVLETKESVKQPQDKETTKEKSGTSGGSKAGKIFGALKEKVLTKENLERAKGLLTKENIEKAKNLLGKIKN